jgi:indole-3-glycerol phosphate synthase
MGFLTEMVEQVRKDLRERPLDEGSLLLRAGALPPVRDFREALAGQGTALIAEVKRASPSAGAIAEADPGDLAERYERAGASAVSVLTEARHFHGSLSDLRSARRRTQLPLLRKDFIVHPGQVIEARAEGADAILLIVPVLSRLELEALLATASDVGLAALAEVHSVADLDKAVEAGAEIVGVNARDLETLEVDLDGACRLAAKVPRPRVVVVESGMRTRGDVVKAEEAGADAVLVGEALMRARNPGLAVRRLLGSLAVVGSEDE